jgi:hypothetical protein
VKKNFDSMILGVQAEAAHMETKSRRFEQLEAMMKSEAQKLRDGANRLWKITGATEKRKKDVRHALRIAAMKEVQLASPEQVHKELQLAIAGEVADLVNLDKPKRKARK